MRRNIKHRSTNKLSKMSKVTNDKPIIRYTNLSNTSRYSKSRSFLQQISTNRSENVDFSVIPAQYIPDTGNSNESIEMNHRRQKTYFHESSQDVSLKFSNNSTQSNSNYSHSYWIQTNERRS